MRVAFGSLALVCAISTTAFAQSTTSGFLLDHFEPSEHGSGWFVLDDLGWHGDLTIAAGVVGDLGVRPLVVHDETGSVDDVLVGDQLFAHVGASLVLKDRFRFGVSLPIALSQSGSGGMVAGDMYAAPDSAAIGDLRLGADVRVLGQPGAVFSLGVGVQLYLPTGDRDQYTGDGSIRIAPHVLLGGRQGIFTWAARVAFEYRGIDGNYDGIDLGSDLAFSGAAGVLVGGRLLVGPELYGLTSVSSSDAFFSDRTTPLEALLGAHFAFTKDLRAGLGVGLGITRGLGSPVARGVLSLEWAMSPESAPPRVAHEESVAQSEPPPLPGTPPPPVTSPPTPPVTPPPATLPDRDGDGIADADDACPDDMGVPLTDPKLNGCPPAPPPPDRDHDGILDDDDACPDEAGPKQADPDLNGCPKKLVVVTRKVVYIAEQIQFKTGSDTILPASDALLAAIAQAFADHPELKMVHVEGHTDATGSKTENQKLSEKRARAVAIWLVKHGVKSNRLMPIGYGGDKPIASNSSSAGRQKNRRVELRIVEREEQK